MNNIEIVANRKALKYTHSEIIGRILWGAVQFAFRYSPRKLVGWRRFLLRTLGAKIGQEVYIYPTAKIFLPWNLEVGDYSAIGDEALIYNLGKISIGARVTISQRTHLCAGTHDYRQPDMPLIRATITVGDDAWICADAFIGPGVIVESYAIVGARSAVFKNVEPGAIVGGNPAKFIKWRGSLSNCNQD